MSTFAELCKKEGAETYSLISFACIALIAGAMTIAGMSIGIKAYNDNEKYKVEHNNNFTFLWITLIVGILLVLCASGASSMLYKSK
jgi:hypothetical protein